MNQPKSISLEPNYPAVFAQFLKDGRTQALNLRERLPRDPVAAAEILRALQAPLASLSIALCALTSTSELDQLRDVMGEFVRYVNQTAAQLEEQAPSHPKITVGYCSVCQHYGEDCTGY